ALILIAGGNVRADFIDWSFDWNVSPSAISSAKFGRAGLWDLGASGMDFNSSSSGDRLYGPSLQAFSDAPAATPDRYDVSYNLTYHVWDRRSHQAGGNLSRHALRNHKLQRLEPHQYLQFLERTAKPGWTALRGLAHASDLPICVRNWHYSSPEGQGIT